jgi:outer membrane protein assembly factor BamB
MKFTIALFLSFAAAAPAVDWLTFGGDPQRSGFARDEQTLTAGNVAGLRVAWKIRLDNVARELNGLTAPLVAARVPAPGGFRDIAIVAGSSDRIYALDADSGKIFWQQTMSVEGAPRNAPSWLCPNALNATPVIDKRNRTIYAIASDGRLHAYNIVNGEEVRQPVQFVPPFSKNWSLNLVDGVIYTTISQRCNGAPSSVYGVDISDPNQPVKIFVASLTGGAGIWGRGGAAVGFDGRVYVETGDGPYDEKAGKLSDTIIGLTPRELKLADYYTPANRTWITKKDLDMGNITPVVFRFKNRELLAGAGKEGVIYLLDTSEMGGAGHRTPLFRSPLWTNAEADFAGRGFWGAFSSFEDAQGTRWLYVPAYGPPTKELTFPLAYGETPNGSVMAFRVVEKDGRPSLEAAWMSRDMMAPEPVIIANGMVFALAAGEDLAQVDEQGKLLTTAQRMARKKGHAVLYAFDANSGAELYNSGDAIAGFTHFSGLALSDGRVFVTTHDGTAYGFSLPE